jgi:hypothetical protein
LHARSAQLAGPRAPDIIGVTHGVAASHHSCAVDQFCRLGSEPDVVERSGDYCLPSSGSSGEPRTRSPMTERLPRKRLIAAIPSLKSGSAPVHRALALALRPTQRSCSHLTLVRQGRNLDSIRSLHPTGTGRLRPQNAHFTDWTTIPREPWRRESPPRNLDSIVRGQKTWIGRRDQAPMISKAFPFPNRVSEMIGTTVFPSIPAASRERNDLAVVRGAR